MEATSVFLNMLSSYKYVLLFPGLVFEGPILTFLAAFMSSPGGGSVMNIYIVFILVLVADITGDIMYYSIGKWGGATMLRRFGSKLGINDHRIEYVKEYYKKHGRKTIALAKISHGLGWPAMVIAGSIGVPFKPFIKLTSVVSLIKSIVFVVLGYLYGESYLLLHHYVSLAGFVITTIALVGLVVASVSLLRKKQK